MFPGEDDELGNNAEPLQETEAEQAPEDFGPGDEEEESGDESDDEGDFEDAG